MAVHVDAPAGLEVRATLHLRPEVDEHPLARLKPSSLTRARARLCAVAGSLLIVLPAGAIAARNPTVSERASIQQALFDDVRAHRGPANPVITRITVSTVRPAGATRRNRYSKFARADLSDPKAGFAAALLGYYVASISGWRVLDLGSSEVGCTVPPKVFRGRKRAILRDLRLRCP